MIDHDDANDLTQEIFIKVHRAIDNFREDAQLYTWLYRIATNECLTFLEQKKRKSTVSLGDVENGIPDSLHYQNLFVERHLMDLFYCPHAG